jgi:hypothetical protein
MVNYMMNDELAPRLGLDIGTSRIVLAQRTGKDFQFRTQLNAFTTVPFSALTANVLRGKQIPHSVDGDRLVIYGDESETFADLFHTETRRPMRNGVLNPDEPDGLSLLRSLLENLAGGRPGTGQKLYFSVPARSPGDGVELEYHQSALKQLLAELGYDACSIPEGLAVVYSELDDANYTGVGVSCGGGMCNVCFAYLSVPVISFSVPKAGDFIDTSAAAMTGEVATRVRLLKERSFHFNGAGGDKIHQAVAVYYENIIHDLVKAMGDAFAGCRDLPKLSSPVPLVLSGGTALPKGFRERFESVLRASDFRLPISEVRLAADPLSATAKGALVAALAEA